MRKPVFVLFLLLLMPYGSVQAKALDIFLNNNTASVEYLTTVGGADAGFGYLYNTSGDWIAHAAMLVFGREYNSASRVEGGLGGKAYLANIGGTSVTGIGLGGQMTFFPKNSKFGFGGYAYYAPSIVTSNAKNLLEFGARAEFQMMETASAYIGVHHFEVGLTPSGTKTVDDGVIFGINIRF